MLKSLKLRNWMNIESADLTFIEGMNIIQGMVGEGKSAVFSAVAYALSDYKRGDSWKDYVKTGEKSFLINLTYQLGNTPDTILTVEYNGDLAKGTVSKELIYKDETFRNSEVDQFLSRHLDQQMLSAVVFNMQGGQQLAQTTPAERRDIFKKIFNSDFSLIVDQVKADKDELQASLIKDQAKLDVLKNKEYTLFRIIEVDNSELDVLQEELKSAQLTDYQYKELSVHTDKLNQLNLIQKSIDKKREALKENEAKLSRLQKSFLEIKEERVAKAKELNELEDMLAVKEKEKEEEIEKYEQLKSSEDIDVLKKEQEEVEHLLIEVRSNLSITQKYLETHKKGKCDTCGQDCDVSHIQVYEDRISLLSAQKKECEESILSIKKRMTEYSEKILHQKTLINDITNDIKLLQSKISNMETTIDTMGSRIKEIEEHGISDLKKGGEDIENEIVSLLSNEKEIEKWIKDNPKPEIKSDHRATTEIQKAIEDIQNRIQGNITKAQMNEKIKKSKEEDAVFIEELNLKINDVSIRVNDLNTVQQIFNTDFPAYINMKACKILESFMNKFLSQVKTGFEIALQPDKKGIAFFYKSNGEADWRNLKMVSGFESALSTLSFKTSIASAFGSSFLFLDEPEANADPKTAELLFETISSITGFKQIFVISHKPEVIDILFQKGNAHGYEVKKGHFTEIIY